MAALVLSTSVHAAPAPDASEEASVLLEQGRRLEAAGRPEVALGLYRAALLLTPDAAEPHLRVAGLLHAQGKCDEAVPEFRAWLALAPKPPPDDEAYTQAVVALSECLRSNAAHLEVQSELALTCSVDGGAARQVESGRPVAFELAAGEHRIVCGNDIATKLAFEPGQKRVLRINAQGRVVGLLRLRSQEPARCAVDEGPPFDVTSAGAQWLLPAGEHELHCTGPNRPAHSQRLTIEATGEHEVVLPEAPVLLPTETAPWPPPGDEPELPPPPMPTLEPEPPVEPEAPIEPAIAELEIFTEGAGWTCHIGSLVRTPNVAGEIFLELPAGDYQLDCELPGARPISQPFTMLAGQRIRIDVARVPLPPAVTPKPAPPKAPVRDREWMIGAGLGPALGSGGVAIGARVGRWSGLLGTGLNPVALTVTHHFNPGGSGLYAFTGWSLVGEGFLRTGDLPAGYGLHVGGGVEVRVRSHFAVRLGAGLGFDSTGRGGPLTFDLSGFWLP